MQASELFALTPADIEQKHEVITITNSKGGKERRVLVKSETVKELFSHVSQKGLGNGAKLFPLKGSSSITSFGSTAPLQG